MITPQLHLTDTIAITAPASKVALNDIEKGVKILQQWGYNVKVGTTVDRAHFNFSDTYENRLQEMQSFLDDPSVRCIIAARGGYGVSDLLDQLNWGNFLKNPKWIIGFSDLTALLLHINTLNVETVHGPMAKSMQCDETSNAYLKQILEGIATHYRWQGSEHNQTGVASGTAIGGNLALLVHTIGTSTDSSYDNKILFIEDVSEKLYAIDRMLVQLKRAGKLDKLAGLVVGDFSDIPETNPYFGENVFEIVKKHTASYHYPIAFNFQFGHEDVNLPIVMGRTYHLNVEKGSVTLKSLNNDPI